MFFLPQDYWQVKKTAKKGRGVFARKEIAPGTLIGDYLGRVVSPAEENEIDEEKNFYLMYYHDRASIFPDLTQPGIYLLNHSCTPNAWMYTYKGHTLFFAIRRIFPGEELTINYLLSPLDDSCKPCTHLCSCSGVICHQTMHLPKKKYERWSAFHNREMNRTKRERVRYGQDVPQLTDYPRSFPDASIYDLFGAQKEKPFILQEVTLPGVQTVRNMIRDSGRTLQFPKLNLHIYGITDGLIISEHSEKSADR